MVKLKVKQVRAEEVRNGYVKISKDSRGNISPHSLIEIRCGRKKLLRLVTGIKNNVSKTIHMDEMTRDHFNLIYNKSYDLEIIQRTHLRDYVSFYLGHPNNGIKFGIQIAIFSLFITAITGVLSVAIGLVQLLASSPEAYTFAAGFILGIIFIVIIRVTFFFFFLNRN